MALIKCPECGKQISDQAVACPQCGFPMHQESMTSKKKLKSLFKSNYASLESRLDAIEILLKNSDEDDVKCLANEYHSSAEKEDYAALHYEKIVKLITVDNISKVSENPEQDYQKLVPILKFIGNHDIVNGIKRYERGTRDFDRVSERKECKNGIIGRTGVELHHRNGKDRSKSITIWFCDGYIVCTEFESSNVSEFTYENLECMNQKQGFSGIDSRGIKVKYDISSVHASIFNLFVDELEKRGILQNDHLNEKIQRTDGLKLKIENATENASVKQAEANNGFRSVFHKRKKLSRDTYMKIYGLQCSKALCDKKGEYLAAFEGRKDFFELEKAYNALPGLYNQYASSILSTQLKITSPISPYAAAAIGTFIGGTAVGIVAAVDAKEKQKTVTDNNKRALEIEAKQKRCQFNLNDCYECVEYYILQNENTAEDWKRQLNSIAQKMNQEYKITK